MRGTDSVGSIRDDLDVIALSCFGRNEVHGILECQQAIDGRLPARKRAIVSDEPGQRTLHLAECISNLCEDSKRDCSSEIPWRSHEQRKDRGKLVVAGGKDRQVLGVVHDLPPVGAYAVDASIQVAAFYSLAVVERDTFGVLAKSDEAEAQISLHALLLKID